MIFALDVEERLAVLPARKGKIIKRLVPVPFKTPPEPFTRRLPELCDPLRVLRVHPDEIDLIERPVSEIRRPLEMNRRKDVLALRANLPDESTR